MSDKGTAAVLNALLSGRVNERGHLAERLLPDGRLLAVYPLTFGRARLGIGAADARCYDDLWCFDSVADAVGALSTWNPEEDPEPAGWTRHPASGRRRPGGDPEREYVRP